MQVVCGNCQLSFQAPEGAAGLMCPICRSPLRPAQAGGDGAANDNIVEWSGGALDDLIAYLSGPALAVRVEVLPATGDTPVGELHLLAGGVSETLYAGKSTDDALDKLRGVNNPRFRLEARLPNPVDGDLTSPGAESGTLDSRPLAHLMRYCEQYVITCGIEVWRGSETARVEYRKGEISGVTVGGIDAPERLAEVMQWSSGNYRLIMPKLSMPESVPKVPKVAAPAPAPAAAAPAPAAAPPARPPATPAVARPQATPPSARPAAPAPPPQAAPARPPITASTHATRTIFGMPALDLAGLKAAEAAAAVTRQAAATAQAAAPAPAATAPAPAPAPAAPAPAVTAAAAAAHAAHDRQSATKTIFGVPAPKIPDKTGEKVVDGKPSEKVIVEKVLEESAKGARPAPAPESAPQKVDRKTGARKTVVPAPAIIPPAAGASPPEAAAPLAAVASTETSEPSRTTHQGYGGPAAAVEVVPARVPTTDDRTAPVRAVTAKKSRAIPVWTYVGVGFLFGLALLGIYQLVGVLAH